MNWLKALVSRPAFFLFGAVLTALALNAMNSWFNQVGTSSVSPSRQTRRVRSAPSVVIHPETVKAPSLSPKVAAQIEKDLGLGKGSVTTAGDILVGKLGDVTVLDEVTQKDAPPEGSKTTSTSLLKKDGTTETVLTTKLPWYSFNQRIGFGLGLKQATIPDFQNFTQAAKTDWDFYGLWEPLHFPKWRSHLRFTINPGHFESFDTVVYGLHLEYRGD